MTVKQTAGRFALGALLALAVAGPTAAQDASRADQPRAQQAIADTQATRDALAQREGLSTQQQVELAKADAEMARASRYYEGGRYRDAARLADHAARRLAMAAAPHRQDHVKEAN